ncbi:MAG: response regulator [Variovorax sp.]|nr:MAG: response regulator [Variovorax sp.]
MPTVVNVVVGDPRDHTWIEAALGPSVELVFVEGGPDLLARLTCGSGHCVILSCDEDEAATLRFVRELRNSGNTMPVIVLGPHTAFRTAVEIARLYATDFLERPVGVHQLRAAVRRAGALG